MVEHSKSTDAVFHALADVTRRDILRRTLIETQTISSLADSYEMSFTAVAKHVNVLYAAQLVIKYKIGREQVIKPNIQKLDEVRALIDSYEALWKKRFENLDALLPHL